MRKRRIGYSELLLVVIYMIVSVCGVFFGIYTDKRIELAATATAFYGSDAKAISVMSSGSGTIEQLTESLKANTEKCAEILIALAVENGEMTVFNGSPKSTSTTYGSIYSTKKSFSLPFTSGRSFTYDDFASGKKYVMLLGSAYANGMMPYPPPYELELFSDYEVLGKIGIDSKNIGSMILMTMNTSDRQTLKGLFVIDGGSASRTASLYDEAARRLTDAGVAFGPIDLPSMSSDVGKFFGVKSLNVAVLLFAALAVVVSTIPVTAVWAKKRFKEISVKRLIGFGRGRIFGDIALNFFIMYNIGFFTSYAVCLLIFGSGESAVVPSLLSLPMLLAYCVGVTVSAATAVAPIVRCMRIEPGDALRRG